jgi:formamidopyrimidine-DNA glycosylase
LGKYLVGTLDDASRLLLHLGMTGQLFGEGAANPRLARKSVGLGAELGGAAFAPDQHTHLVFQFAATPAVFFRDARKFGKVEWLPAGASSPRLDKLGPDALVITPEDFHTRLRRKGGPIKTELLNQSVLAGAGNIYADEALFLSGIRPTRPANQLSLKACSTVLEHLRTVLLRSIDTGGSSISDYVAPDGSDGGYQNERRVYSRTGEPCSICGTPIKRKTLGQRSTHYCPKCQPR